MAQIVLHWGRPRADHRKSIILEKPFKTEVVHLEMLSDEPLSK